MRRPPIAPITRREARVARGILAGVVAERSKLSRELDASVVADHFDAMAASLRDALAEYAARPWYRRWLPGAPGHRMRLRAWLIQERARLAGMVDDRS
jgi:hypothetical protein